MRERRLDRTAITVAVALVIGGVLRWQLGWPVADPVLVLIAVHEPALYRALYVAYTTLLFTTPYLVCSVIGSLAYIFVGRVRRPATPGALPPYPAPETRDALFVILGEQHHPTRPVPVATPRWLTIPERGLFTGIAVIGAVGSGKTSGCLYPYAEQILGYGAQDHTKRIGGLVLEVKGDFCHDVRRMLAAHGRADDYVEISLDGPWRYNPLHSDLDAYALAYGIASLLNNVFGKGKEPFWQQAYTNLVKFLILLHRVADDYVTLFDVYVCAINPDELANVIARAEARVTAGITQILVAAEQFHHLEETGRGTFFEVPDGDDMVAPETPILRACLEKAGVAYRTRVVPVKGDDPRREQLEAIKRWYEHDWRRIEPKLRTSIVEGIAVVLSLFDDSPTLKRVFCPPKACYDPVANADGRFGRPLPSMGDLIETGTVCALNFPMASNPGLARLIGTLLKQDFQRAVLTRIPHMTSHSTRHWREVLFLCDEYHAFATAGEEDPTGDEKFFSLSRQGKCIAIVATQSVSSLKSALPGETWRTLLQTFRTKVFLTLSDDFSAKVASDLCGRAERLVPQYHLAESGQDARVSVLTGRATAHRASISTSKSYGVQRDAVFEAKVFAELANAQAIVLAYDGVNPWSPTYGYLKPHYLPRTETYFQQRAAGKV